MVVSHTYPYLKVRCQVRVVKVEELTYVDTGYDGGLVIPSQHLNELGSPDEHTIIELGDGTRITAPEYYGEVENA
ncbi:hypothetical protein M1O13_01105 [Dehalococcoidia bacterium]|nr:hypothetical protein [Dehalococcoidia bacterium]